MSSYFDIVYKFMPLITSILMVYIFLIVLVYARKYINTYAYNKRLTFTRDSLKELRQEINYVLNERYLDEKMKNDRYWGEAVNDEYQVSRIMSMYNELAVGINEGLYDELYVKTIIGSQMARFYKRYYKIIMDNNEDSYYIPLELLLKRWESIDAPVYRQKYRRGI